MQLAESTVMHAASMLNATVVMTISNATIQCRARAPASIDHLSKRACKGRITHIGRCKQQGVHTHTALLLLQVRLHR